MVRAKYTWPPVFRIFIEPMHVRSLSDAGAVAYQNVVKDETGQGVICVAPAGNRWWDSEAKASVLQDLPGPLISPTAKIQVRSQDHCVIGN